MSKYSEDEAWKDVVPIKQDDGPDPVCPIAYTAASGGFDIFCFFALYRRAQISAFNEFTGFIYFFIRIFCGASLAPRSEAPAYRDSLYLNLLGCFFRRR